MPSSLNPMSVIGAINSFGIVCVHVCARVNNHASWIKHIQVHIRMFGLRPKVFVNACVFLLSKLDLAPTWC